MPTASHEKKLLAVQGYYELGLPAEALEELEAIADTAFHERTDVLSLHMMLLMDLRRWADALGLAQRLCEREPHSPVPFIQAAFCLHEIGQTREARAILREGPATLVRDAVYHYNLACYEAVLGDVEAAQAHLRDSFRINPAMREAARKDRDLEPIWDLL